MSHVMVGERLISQAPEIIGHVIVGAGHFLEQANGLIQQFSQTGNVIPVIANRNLPDLSNPVEANRWQWDNMERTYGRGSLMASANYESSAAERALRESIEKSFENMMDASVDLGLSIGSALSGDPQAALSYGASATEKFVQGTLRDFGFMGGWSSGAQPGQGTCPMTGEGRPN